jgi:glucan phosphoethanolaminetransferase (alkaline phosphatase superfamily)
MYFSFAFFNGVQLRNIFKKVAYTDVSALRIVGAIGTGIALSQTIIGLIFKFNEWPGAFVMMSVGLSGLLVVAIVGFIQFAKNKIDYYRNIFKRIALFGVLALILVVLPSNLMFEFKYRNYPTYIEAYKKFIENPTNKELSDKVAAERRKVFDR